MLGVAAGNPARFIKKRVTKGTVNISILILTLNEEDNLRACLESVKWSDDIVVLDSGSSDRTTEIAGEYGVRVIKRPFDNELNQRTFSLREISFKYPWVYNPDADEITTGELRDEMLRAVTNGQHPEVAYRVRFKTMFMGRWLRYSSLYPTWVMRLFRPEKISFRRTTNLQYICDGPEGHLQGHLIHRTFNKGFDAWFHKHNVYSHFEAREALESIGVGSLDWRGVFNGDPVRRRRALKELSFRLPLRPLLRFCYMFVLRRGFLDGYPGFAYCMLLAIYEYMIVLKIKELRLRKEGLAL
ncbi:MAG: glycosyltransferase family 2 protein [Nitrospirota bacterium]